MQRKLNQTLLIGLFALIGCLIWFATSSTPSQANDSTPSATCAADSTTCATALPFEKLPDPKENSLDLKTVKKIDLKTLPIIPTISDHVLAIYEEGQQLGNNPKVFSKAGDCMTATPHFLEPFASKDAYTLDKYSSLQKVIDYYSDSVVRSTDKAQYNSFSDQSLSAASGFNVPSVLDSTWADPSVCSADESPLDCEYRVSKPSVAIIMFGTNDVKSIQPADFDFYLRKVIVQTANAGIVPVLSTFPTEPALVDKSVEYNQIVAQIAQDYDIPLINLWLALEPLPNRGIDPVNTTHMTQPKGDDSVSFTEDNLKYGYNVRNLLTLQTLEAVLEKVNPAALK